MQQHLVEEKPMKKILKLGFLPFSYVGLIIFPWIAYSDSLQQCLTSDRAKIHEKKIWGPNLGQMGQNQARN